MGVPFNDTSRPGRIVEEEHVGAQEKPKGEEVPIDGEAEAAEDGRGRAEEDTDGRKIGGAPRTLAMRPTAP